MAEISSMWLDDYTGVSTDVTLTTASTSSTFDGSDRMVVLVRNTSTETTYTGTIVSVANRQGRTENIAITLAPSTWYSTYLHSHGWLTTGGKLEVASSNAAIVWGVANLRD